MKNKGGWILSIIILGVIVVFFQNFSGPDQDDAEIIGYDALNKEPIHDHPGKDMKGNPKPIKVRTNFVKYRIKKNATRAQLNLLDALLTDYKIKKMRFHKDDPLVMGKVHNKRGLSEPQLANLLWETGAVDFANPDFSAVPTFSTNDSHLGQQWYLGPAPISTNAIQAWDWVQGKPSVSVVVCDMGIEASHPDLSAAMSPKSFDFAGYSGGSATEPLPGDNHGTLMAGIIGATGNNGIGIAGVAWGVKLMAHRIGSSRQGYFANYISSCIDFAKLNHARVVNISFLTSTADIEYAAMMARDAGITVAVGAGNSNCNLSIPAPGSDETTGFWSRCQGGVWDDGTPLYFYLAPSSYILYVASSNNIDDRVSLSSQVGVEGSGSSYGRVVDIAASSTNVYSTTEKGSYGNLSWGGTSSATAMVSGAAALIYSANPSYTPDEVDQILFESARKVHLSEFTNGVLDIGAAIRSILPADANRLPIPKIEPALSNTSGFAPLNVDLNGTQSSDLDGFINNYEWNHDISTSISSTPDSVNQGFNYSYTVPGIYALALKVTDNLGASSTQMRRVVVKQFDPAIMYVNKIDMSWVLSKGKYTARATVYVVDANKAAVRSATIKVIWYYRQPGGGITVMSFNEGKTGNNGSVAISAMVPGKYDLLVNVTAVTASGKIYDPDLNVETSDIINAAP